MIIVITIIITIIIIKFIKNYKTVSDISYLIKPYVNLATFVKY